MKQYLLTIPFFLISGNCVAEIKCVLDKTKPADEENRSVYVCKDRYKSFKLLCDGSTDAEYKTPPVNKATWKKSGPNEGIEFKNGFSVCKKVVK